MCVLGVQALRLDPLIGHSLRVLSRHHALQQLARPRAWLRRGDDRRAATGLLRCPVRQRLAAVRAPRRAGPGLEGSKTGLTWGITRRDQLHISRRRIIWSAWRSSNRSRRVAVLPVRTNDAGQAVRKSVVAGGARQPSWANRESRGSESVRVAPSTVNDLKGTTHPPGRPIHLVVFGRHPRRGRGYPLLRCAPSRAPDGHLPRSGALFHEAEVSAALWVVPAERW